MIIKPIEETGNDVIYRLKTLIRYNTRNRIKDESVAEHSFFAAIFAMKICRTYGIPEFEDRALRAALLHDIPELFLSDVPHDVKQEIKGLKEILEEHEKKILDTMFGDHPPQCLMVSTILDLADVESVIQYVESEIILGNNGMDSIMEDSLQRRGTLQARLAHLIYEHRKDVDNAKK